LPNAGTDTFAARIASFLGVFRAHPVAVSVSAVALALGVTAIAVGWNVSAPSEAAGGPPPPPPRRGGLLAGGPLSLEARCRMDQAARHQIDALDQIDDGATLANDAVPLSGSAKQHRRRRFDKTVSCKLHKLSSLGLQQIDGIGRQREGSANRGGSRPASSSIARFRAVSLTRRGDA